MPLVAYKNLPTFDRLKKEGRTILPPERAQHQDIRELHIGLLNMMPDAALQATERQFFRLVGESNQIAQLYVHPFTLPEIPRSDETKAYISECYEPFDKLQDEGLDALIITGANVSKPDLEENAFWEPLMKVFDWGWDNVTSTMCSCLATHAVMQFKYNQKRSVLDNGKLWGVYGHRVSDRTHPLVRNMNTVFDVPHSRFNRITTEQFKKSGMKILIESKDAGTHMAVSPDGFRLICMQGHPEYDTVSLMKEYQRDFKLYEDGKIPYKPALPQNYCEQDIMEKISGGNLEDCLENTWRDSARSILASWIGLVYQVTHADRKKQFMDGVDPDNPLGI